MRGLPYPPSSGEHPPCGVAHSAAMKIVSHNISLFHSDRDGPRRERSKLNTAITGRVCRVCGKVQQAGDDWQNVDADELQHQRQSEEPCGDANSSTQSPQVCTGLLLGCQVGADPAGIIIMATSIRPFCFTAVV